MSFHERNKGWEIEASFSDHLTFKASHQAA